MKNTVANAEFSSFSSSKPSGANVALMSIRDLQKLCGENARKSGWHADRPKSSDFPGFTSGDHGPHRKALLNWRMTKIMLVVSELAEGAEELRAGKLANENYYTDSNGLEYINQLNTPSGTPTLKPEGLPSELADTVIRVLDFCFTEGIDLQSMIQEKLDFNQTRGVKHGGKAV